MFLYERTSRLNIPVFKQGRDLDDPNMHSLCDILVVRARLRLHKPRDVLARSLERWRPDCTRLDPDSGGPLDHRSARYESYIRSCRDDHHVQRDRLCSELFGYSELERWDSVHRDY
jgi:hypothetical protein